MNRLVCLSVAHVNVMMDISSVTFLVSCLTGPKDISTFVQSPGRMNALSSEPKSWHSKLRQILMMFATLFI